MIFHFKYNNFSYEGLPQSVCALHNSIISHGYIPFNHSITRGFLQAQKLPGDIGIIFSEYEYTTSILLEHLPEKEERYLLWIDIAESQHQFFTINGTNKLEQREPEQKNIYLVNTRFHFSHYRSKGTKGKSLMIFLPPEVSALFLKDNSLGNALSSYYKLRENGLNSITILPAQEKIMEGVFYQWHQYRNTMTITKYVYQLIEWYFATILAVFKTDTSPFAITGQEAEDLYQLQLYVTNMLNESKLPDDIYKNFSTPPARLEELFKTVYQQTPAAFLKTKKMEKAMQLLTTTNESVASIAFELGYSNPSNFAEMFKSKYNATPNGLRRQIKEQMA
jgi:AraC-like DNA-binding protein